MNTCQTCHWWHEESYLIGVCVFHNGMKGTSVSKVRFNGTLKTQPDFGCVSWSEDRRQKPVEDTP